MSDDNASTEAVGRAKGGLARAQSLTPEERQSIAIAAAKKRWSEIPTGDLPTVKEFRGELVFGDIKLPCAVLDNGKRVVSETGITLAIFGGRSGGSRRKRKAAAEVGSLLPLFLAPSQLDPYIDKASLEGPLTPIWYRDGRRTVLGYDAELLPAVCEIWLKAREAGSLQAQQLDKAQKAEILMRSLAKVGVIALIDEATGYQEVRKKEELQAILDAYLRKELAAWAKRFPDEFYQQIFRLRNWEWKGRGTNPPQVVAAYTKDIVYARLAPGIIGELEKRNPSDGGKRRSKHHQWLTEEVGHPALAQHLHAVITLMRVAPSWNHFKGWLDIAHPKRGDTLQLNLMADVFPLPNATGQLSGQSNDVQLPLALLPEPDPLSVPQGDQAQPQQDSL